MMIPVVTNPKPRSRAYHSGKIIAIGNNGRDDTNPDKL